MFTKKAKILEIENKIKDLERSFKILEEQKKWIEERLSQITDTLKSVQNLKNEEERLTKLEIWKAELHSKMIESTPNGKPKLTKFGKSLRDKYNV